MIHTPEALREIQEYFIKYGAEPDIEGVEFEGIGATTASDEVATALAESDAIVIGPSNPVISIGPILAVPGMRDAIASSPAPVVAVSPFVVGKTVKGPTEKCLRGVGAEPSASGVADLYGDLLDGFVADDGDPEPPRAAVATIQIPTLMHSQEARRELAERTLAFARELA